MYYVLQLDYLFPAKYVVPGTANFVARPIAGCCHLNSMIPIVLPISPESLRTIGLYLQRFPVVRQLQQITLDSSWFKLICFIYIGPPVVELWCHIDFQDGGRSGVVLSTPWIGLSRRNLVWSFQDSDVIQSQTWSKTTPLRPPSLKSMWHHNSAAGCPI